MNGLLDLKINATDPAIPPPAGYVRLYGFGTNTFRLMDSAGTAYTVSFGVSPEEIQDAIGAILSDSSTINLTYDDSGNLITADVIGSAVTGVLAANVVNTPAGGISAGTVQGAINELDSEKQSLSEKGQANGYASLDSGGKVPAGQLPSFVDDVLEYANLAAFPVTGENAKIYVALDTNKTYRWSGSAYIEISPSAVTSVFGRSGAVTAQAGDYTASQVTNTPAGTIAATTVQAALNELDSEKVPTTRTISPGAGMSGGGALSANLTLTNADRGSVAVTAHEALTDPHPQYLTPAEGNAAYEAAGAVAAHVGLTDPHPQYLTPAEGNAAYDALGAAAAAQAFAIQRGNHTGTQTASTVSDFTEAAQDAVAPMITGATHDGVSTAYNDAGNTLAITNTDKGSAAVATHVAALDPHPQYTTAAELSSALGSYQPLDGDLTAVANLTGAGLVTRTSANNMTTRSIAQGTGITVANGDGVAGNPTITNSDTGSAAVATHVAAGDPHTQYQLESALPADVRATTLTGISITNGVVSAADSVLSAFGKIQGWINDASTNFAASVRGTVLTGLSVVNSAVTAADSILTAIGKIQGQLDELFTIDAQWIELNTSSTYTNTSSVTGVGVTELDLAIVAGTSYYYEATLLYQSAGTTTGLEVTIVSPDGASAPGAVLVNMQQSGDGTAALFTGTINALGDYVESTGVQAANTPYVCHIKGNFPATASGTLRIAFRSENGGTQVTVLPGSTLLARAFS